MKSVSRVFDPPSGHWVGDGFPVRSLFSYHEHTDAISPFLLLDFAGPYEFAPAQQPRGVGVHPHRGIETVTIVYHGEVAHQDSSGGGGTIGPGDVQWMTAGGGILHQEFHSPAFTARGGVLQMVQLWVNLPAASKMTPAGYQSILANQMPHIDLADDAGTLRLIGGQFGDHQGPAHTFSPLCVADAKLNAGKEVRLAVPAGWNTQVVVLEGHLLVGGQRVGPAQVINFERAGEDIALHPESDAMVLLLAGQPIQEPVVGYGPFVMNTREEIMQAIRDFESGKFGRMEA